MSESNITLGGLHHVTAITGDAPRNVRFYTQVLGMRLVKKTVNQDDVSAYHLFYADEVGSPGTEVTFFDWPNSPRTLPGPATIAPIGLRVGGPRALEWWAKRLDEHGAEHGEVSEVEGALSLHFSDPEGQRLVLVDDGGSPAARPWAESPVPAEMAIRGLHHVTVNSARPAESEILLTRLLGFQVVDTLDLPAGAGTVKILETGAGGPGTRVRLLAGADEVLGQPGIGGVHHVAFRTPDPEQHEEWRQRLSRAGVGVTPVIDRFYFRSIYFREPGGVLFEIATDGPGFTTDEPVAELGRHLALPPFLEPRRKQIEAGLAPLGLPVGG